MRPSGQTRHNRWTQGLKTIIFGRSSKLPGRRHLFSKVSRFTLISLILHLDEQYLDASSKHLHTFCDQVEDDQKIGLYQMGGKKKNSL